MANSLVQIRVDEKLKKNVTMVAMQSGNKAVLAMQQMSQPAEENGVADMSLDEINEEIQAVRNGKTSLFTIIDNKEE